MNRKMWAITASCALLSVVVALIAGGPRPEPPAASRDEPSLDELAQRERQAPTQPVKPTTPAKVPTRKIPSRIAWRTSMTAALDEARRDGKPLMVDFGAKWCPPCVLLDKEVWPKPKVIQAVQAFVPVKVDVDKHRDLVKRYKVEGYPTVLFLDSSGKPIGSFSGFRDVEQITVLLRVASAKARESVMTARGVSPGAQNI